MTDPLLGEAPPPVRKLTGHTHAAVLPSGTAALAAALHALDVHGTEVDIPAIGCWTLTTAVWEAGGVPAYVDVDDTLQARRVSERPGIVIAPWGLVAAPGSCRLRTVLDASVSLTRHQDPAAAITVISLGGGKPGAISGGVGYWRPRIRISSTASNRLPTIITEVSSGWTSGPALSPGPCR